MKKFSLLLVAALAFVAGACERHSASELDNHGDAHTAPQTHAPAEGNHEAQAPKSETAFPPGGQSSDKNTVAPESRQFFPKTQ